MWNAGWTLATIIAVAGGGGLVLAVVLAILLGRYA